MTDVLVAGGGPVGLGAALYAARAGMDVTVCEPRADVIDKACGEGLMPAAVEALAALGVEPPGHPLTGIRYLDGAIQVEAAFRRGTGRGVRRTALHAALRAAVADAGIPVEHHAVRQVRQDTEGVTVDGRRARFLLAADGLHSPVRRELGLQRPAAGRRVRRHGLRRHVATAPWTSFVEVHWAPAAEAYVTPVADDLVGIALLTAERASFDELLRHFPALLARVDGLAQGSVMGAGPLRVSARRRVAGRVLLVGDAAGYVDALTGEGIALGLAQARAAVHAVATGRTDGYEATWRRITRGHRFLTGTLLAASARPAVRRRIVPAAAALPRVFDTAVNVLAEPPRG